MKKGDLNGIVAGYGKLLRQKIPKDIVICDWHYYPGKEYLSLDTFQREGFKVIATTWNNEEGTRNFTRYAKLHHAYGVMSSIWYNARVDKKKQVT